MECVICSAPICTHGIIHVLGDEWKCIECGQIGYNQKPPIYVLHLYQGKIEPRTEVQSPVCAYCHQKLSEGFLT